jgi:CRISPR system Cascade subunit CasE
MSGSLPLTLLRLTPDLHRLSRWAATTRQTALQVDLGYALHAATQATLGALAPRPFVVRQREHQASVVPVHELVGYVAATQAELERAAQLPPPDPLAAAAVGLQTLDARTMPAQWRNGERLSFEARVAPLVRSRTARAGAVVEIDAAHHRSLAGDTPGDREAAYGAWLARELQRGGAATLASWATLRFQLTPIARRSQTRDGMTGRNLSKGLVPDLTVRGELLVVDGAAFNALLARGLGRHRAFGYGCLLLAPAGVLHRRA